MCRVENIAPGVFPFKFAHRSSFLDVADPNWNLALDDAIRAESQNSPGINVFLEEREDLTAELRTGSDRSVTHTFWRGGAARASSPASRLSYLADPAPEDAARLVRSVVDERLRFPERGVGDTAAVGAESRIAPADPESVVEELAARIELERPGVEMLARYVAFDQRIRIARAGAAGVEDRRRGARLRVEARLVSGRAWILEPSIEVGAVAARVARIDSERLAALKSGSLVRRLDERLDARPAPGRRAGRSSSAPGSGGSWSTRSSAIRSRPTPFCVRRVVVGSYLKNRYHAGRSYSNR